MILEPPEPVPEHPALHARRLPRVRSIVFGVLGLLLAWQVCTRTLVAYLAEASPSTALKLRTDAAALVALSDRRLNTPIPVINDSIGIDLEDNAAPDDADAERRSSPFARYPRDASGGDAEARPAAEEESEPTSGRERFPSNAADPVIREEVRALALQALASDPLNARALRILGQVADARDEESEASRLMHAAVRRSQRESVAVFWLMQEAFDKGDYAATVRFADILFRTRPQMAARIAQTLARIAETADASRELKQMLAANPPWRAMFFNAVLQHVTDARTPLDLLLSFKDTDNPPTNADLRNYFDLLIRNNFHELAYYVWLQFLPREQLANVGLLFNASFENKPSGLPFDWSVSRGSGVTVDFARRPDAPRRRALLVEFGIGRVDFKGVSQLVMLAPGTYRLGGQYRAQLTGRRGLEWRVRCMTVRPGPLLGKSPMVTGTTLEWTDFSFVFTVPDNPECRAQEVRLWLDARSASEQLVSGSAWYDLLQITRLEQQTTASTP